MSHEGRTITIGARTQYVTRVSDEDYDFLMQWKWTYAVSHPKGGLVYARRSLRVGDQNVTVLMHRVIIDRMGIVRPSLLHFVDHENGHSLDNRRVNDAGCVQLRWLTNKENNALANKRGIRSVPLGEPSSAHAEAIPF